MQQREALTAYTGAFVDELARVQVKHVVVSPGSRSTPLAYMLSEHPDITVHINIDERSAGFFALGMSKALKEPVGLLCTSGTAAANYYPAIVEANISRIPLIVLTADRPHELRNVGAPQAIDQIHLYGQHVKWFVEMALPEDSKEIVRYARTVCARAASTAMASPAGPVHLNFPFREPLIPYLNEPKWFGENEKAAPAIDVQAGSLTLSESQFSSIAKKLSSFKKGIIICGPIDNMEFKEAIVRLGEKLGFPILADPLSQLRSGNHSFENIIDTYDTFMRNEELIRKLECDVILRFGAMPVSKALTIFLKKQTEAEILVVDGGAGWREPTGTASYMIHCDEINFCHEVFRLLPNSKNEKWKNFWQELNQFTQEQLNQIKDVTELDEGKLFSILPDIMPQKSNLFVGNSMPIRDLDSFFFGTDKDIRIFANRGANGIDGVVSSALGVSAILNPTVLVIGDLSFFHDMNGLLAAKLLQLNITIVLVNNDGGGIFSFLPQSNEQKHFEALFGTPHGLDFEHAINLYGGKYHSVSNWDEFKSQFNQSFSEPGLKVIEMKTNRESNVQKHREMWNNFSREMNLSFFEEKR